MRHNKHKLAISNEFEFFTEIVRETEIKTIYIRKNYEKIFIDGMRYGIFELYIPKDVMDYIIINLSKKMVKCKIEAIQEKTIFDDLLFCKIMTNYESLYDIKHNIITKKIEPQIFIQN